MRSQDFEIGTASSVLIVWDFVHDGEPPLGAHLVTPRRGYCHHGIYIGQGKVVHYAGFSSSFHRGPVEELSVAHFAANRQIFVQSAPNQRYSREVVVQRARSRLGEHHYRLLTNNCEHFCNWCLYGEGSSEQVSQFWQDILTFPLKIMENLTLRISDFSRGSFRRKRQADSMWFSELFSDF